MSGGSSNTGNFVTDLIAAQLDAKTVYKTGKVMSTPALVVTDGVGLIYAVDVDIGLLNADGTPALLRNVPIAANNGVIFYAQQGTAVNLTRSASGQYRVTGLSQVLPGNYVRIPVDVPTSTFGAPVDHSLRLVRITLGDLATLGGGFGVIPLGATALYQGATLLEITS